jgi:hypothetical protein
MKRLTLSLFTAALALGTTVTACKKERGSGVKTSTNFGASGSKDLLTYDKDYSQQEFETAYNALFDRHDVRDGYKCKVRRIQKFRNAAKPELASFQALDDSELIGVITYTSMAYTKINKPLRIIKNNQDALLDDLARPEAQRMTEIQRKALQADIEQAFKDLEPWRLIVMAASSGLNKLPRYDKPVIRGSSIRDEFIKGYCEKECAAAADPASCKLSTEAAFMSTTFNPTLGGFRGNAKFHVAGTSGRAVNAISAFPAEGEVLFAPGSDFLVTGVRFSDGSSCKNFLTAYAAKGATPATAPAPLTPPPAAPDHIDTNVGLELTGVAALLADPADPTDCPDVASVEAQTNPLLAQTSIGEAITGKSTLPVGLADGGDVGMALVDEASVLKAGVTVEIDLKEVRR